MKRKPEFNTKFFYGSKYLNDIDRTYEALLREPFDKVVNKIYEADPHGSMTFNRMNSDNAWKVQSSYHSIVLENGWSIEEFNKQVHKEFNEQ